MQPCTHCWLPLFGAGCLGLACCRLLMRWPMHSPVGWNCTNSRSCSGSPARAAMALPSPVQVCAEVAEK